ncbi:MAG: hypothetical protein ACK515_11795 [bacterium]|nr:hypothetical protein [Betaproteobacteria bacterium]
MAEERVGLAGAADAEADQVAQGNQFLDRLRIRIVVRPGRVGAGRAAALPVDLQ